MSTESINKKAIDLETKTSLERIAFLNDSYDAITSAIEKQYDNIQRAVGLVEYSLRHNGVIFFAGSGTSCRLGVIQAAEIPPTYGMPKKQFRAILSGGNKAVFSSVEGAEDDYDTGFNTVRHDVKYFDTIIVLSAGGNTPFALGCIEAAHHKSVRSIGIQCNDQSSMSGLYDKKRLDVLITLPVGPEVPSGSTRMVAGSAQKRVLDIITTETMYRLNKIAYGRMVSVTPASRKLYERAVKDIMELSGCSKTEADDALNPLVKDCYDSPVKLAVVMLAKDLNIQEARQFLMSKNGNLRAVLEPDIE